MLQGKVVVHILGFGLASSHVTVRDVRVGIHYSQSLMLRVIQCYASVSKYSCARKRQLAQQRP
jgi:hypothetical protein